MHEHQFDQTDGSLRDFPEVGLLRCSFCGVVVHDKDVSDSVSYESGTMHEWSKSWGDRNPPDADFQRRISALERLRDGTTESKHLDYGCGSGGVVGALRDKGVESFGFDPEIGFVSKNLVEKGFIVGKDNDLQDGSFNIISLFHVIEHVYQPDELLKRLHRLLASGGKLVVETPNSNDALATTYGCQTFQRFTYWSHHPYVFSNFHLEELLSDNGYEIEISTQVQRYGLANHMYWLSKGLRGGHSVWPDLFSRKLDGQYGLELINSGTADTIWIVAKKV